MAMFEKAEDEYNILISKKNIIENDISKIKMVIEELDERKKETLKVTWVKVNKDFGSIFSTLLPGTMAKLEPLEGYSFLDGFIFGFASFKPTPLNEVHAALDLSVNIGRMINTHFPHSQLIVVSLKEGMFNNANVLFLTKFVHSVSTLQRTVTNKQSK